MEGALALIFGMIFTASSVYQVTMAGLSALQLVLVGTALELAVFVFEVPTGVVADVYSRRISIIIGIFLIGLGFVVEGSFPLFWTILLAQVLWGLGYTFTSGATQAWITDEVGEATAGKAFLFATQVGQIAALVGIGAGILLGNWRVNVPIQLGGFCLVVMGFLLTLVMPETGFTPASRSEHGSWRNMISTFRAGLDAVRYRPVMHTILGIGFIYGLYSEGLDRLWTKHILDGFPLPVLNELQPVFWIGSIRAVGMLLSVGAAEVARRKIDTSEHLGVAKALFIVTSILAVSLFSFALSGTLILALITYWIISASRNIISPVYYAWINHRLDSRVRATVLSMSGQVDAIGQITGGPVVGLIGNLISVRAALVTSSLILSPTLVLYQRIIGRDGKTPRDRK
jgi:DHA3 family tetracycline resistance protein-like MFS transporter